MIGLVLAAGQGQRLRPLTEDLPKTLLEVAPERSILDVALANLRAVGLREIVVVVGFAAHRIEARAAALEARHDVALTLVHNPRAVEWNNAYSLWLAREHLTAGALLVNGDTVHPPSVERTLLDARESGGDGLVLALDAAKPLGEEEMKVVLRPDGGLGRINKALDPATAAGEYIGLTLIEPAAAGPLADALEATWRRDPGLYYEDGFQELADRGGEVRTAEIGAVAWCEVDDHADLARAREIACRS
jgi:choline kinase